MDRFDRRNLHPDEAPHPVHVVWELTMRCDQPCTFCGSRAGAARPQELDTAQCLEVCRQLAAMGAREVVLIGGEAYLRPDVYEVVACLADLGIWPTLQTGGRALTPERARRFKDAGLRAVGVSVDGVEAVHDVLRGNKGSWAATMRALDAAHGAGLATGVNTQVNTLSADCLDEVAEAVRDHHARAWRAQLTVPMGNAADRPELILPPWRIVEVIDTLAAIQRRALAAPRPWELPFPKRSFDVQASNNIGYFGPHEELLRSHPGEQSSYYGGCGAGVSVLGIESDGTLKGCPSLPTAPYASGSILDRSLAEVWAGDERMRVIRDRDEAELWGFCKTCEYADVCRGGCSFTTHATLGRRGNNPFCYHRVTTLGRRGIRERLVHVEAAPGDPYDFGRFEIVEEPTG